MNSNSNIFGKLLIMKNYSVLSLSLFFNVAYQCTLLAQSNDFIPPEFAPLRNTFDEAFANFSRYQVQSYDKTELLIAEQVASDKFYPTLNAGANTGWSKPQVYKNGERVNTNDSAALNSGVNVNLSQNLYAGGSDVLGKNIAKINVENSELQNLNARRYFLFGFTRELNGLIASQSSLKQTFLELEKVKMLSVANLRKQKSGFMGAKETLETQNETQRAQRAADLEQMQFQNALLEFNAKFGLKSHAMSDSEVEKANGNLKKICGTGLNFYSQADAKEKLIAQSVALKLGRNSRYIAELNLNNSRIQRWSPRLDFSAGIGMSKAHNLSFLGATKADTSVWTLNPSANLSFSVSLWNPTSWSQFETSQARLKAADVSLESTQNESQLALEKNKVKMELLQLKSKAAAESLKLGSELHGQNKRLFEAGELNLAQYIESQNSVFRIQKEINALENDIQTSSCDAWLQSRFGFLQSGDFQK